MFQGCVETTFEPPVLPSHETNSWGVEKTLNYPILVYIDFRMVMGWWPYLVMMVLHNPLVRPYCGGIP